MNPGDLVCVEGKLKFILRELDFKQYCDKLDDHMLEYDIDDAWEKWQEEGPVWEIIDEDGRLSAIWEIDI